MDIRDELHQALDHEQFSNPALLAQAMSRLDAPRQAKGQRFGPLVAAVLAIALVLTLVVIRVSRDGFFFPGLTPTLPVSSHITGITGYQFVSPDVGWLNVTTSKGTLIAKTVDGGKTWRSELAFSGPFGLRPPPMQFFGDKNGVVIGQNGRTPTVWRTSDGGATWKASPLPTDGNEELVSGYFVDSQNGWVMTSRSNLSPTDLRPAFVYRTTDGAQHWSQATTLPGKSGIGWTGISFAGLSDGFITTSAGYANSQSWGAPLPLFATRDGGATWTKVDLKPPLAGAFIEAVLSFSEGAGILIVEASHVESCPGQSGCVAITPAGRYLYSTADGGHTWSDPQSIGHGYLALIDSHRWVLLTADGLSMSSDAGKTWSTPRALALPSGWFATETQFLDAQRGWVTLSDSSEGNFQGAGAFGPGGKTALVYTGDGGSSWQAVQLPSSLPPVSAQS
jgi:photosystem II stability/assembly factor-like uncharacterized protein